MTILKAVFVILLLWGIYHSRSLLPARNRNPPDPDGDIDIDNYNDKHDANMLTGTAAAAGPKIYDALIIGGGPAGMSAALALARVCRTSILFDSGEYRNQGAPEMHTFLSRDGIPPEQFRATARQQIQDKYSAQVDFMKSRVVHISNTEILQGYKGFEAVDSANQTFRGRKLVLATGTEDLIPTDDEVEGYKENWPEHM
jgi:gliotoxin/aspirochlorine biosynthesis thioredoxin reductase